jgi:hypothetical protein
MLKSLINFLFRRREADSRKKEQIIISPESWTDDSVRFAAGDFPPDDGKIDPSFDYSSGDLPPDWEARRIAVLHRDNFVCQAPGCLVTGRNLNAHHIRARWEGGNHKLENLIALCPVHHALVHLDTKKVTFKDARCTIVSRFWRRKPFSSEKVEVRSFIRRFVLITPSELAEVRKRFNPKCHWCGKTDWKGFWRTGLIWTWCPECNGRWEFEPGLREETATQLVMAFPAMQNLGRFKFSGDLIHGIRQPTPFEGCPEWLRHGRRGYLLEKDGQFGRFVGCNEWPVCDYSR